MLEAHAIAHHLAGTPSAEVRQVARCGTPGQTAADALARALEPPAAPPPCLPSAAPLTEARWRTLLGDARTLVLWLDAGDAPALEALAASAALDNVTDVYLSSSLLGGAVRVPEPLRRHVVLAHPFVVPDEFERHAVRSLRWLKANTLEPADRGVAVNALFAIVLAADALSLPGTLGSREYFVETIEHMANRSVMPTAYPSVSFDARRRFASAGAYLLRMPSSPDQSFGKVEEWYVPES
jgi:hypothetical protein